mmetsp:Transcript_68114/g.154133  ORF Transcript_68114/g.154133 Transcript_68114/m.154133 type:complete len:364 (-) Transcript_68114:100-1191(-)
MCISLRRFFLLVVSLPPICFMHVWWTLNRHACLQGPEEANRMDDPSPDWLRPALEAMPRRSLSAEDLEAMNVDGGTVVRGLIPNKEVLDLLNKTFWGPKGNPKHAPWYNEVLKDLSHYSPLPSLASSSLNGKPVFLWNAQVEPRPAASMRAFPDPRKPWEDMGTGSVTSMSVHNDVGAWKNTLHSGGHFVVPLSSIFLAISDIPHGLKLLAGSHIQNRKFKCPDGPALLDSNCMDPLEEKCNGERSWDLKAGDAIIFWGEAFHWTEFTPNPRLAISIRYLPSDFVYTGGLTSVGGRGLPPPCSPLGGSLGYPILYPPEEATTDFPFPQRMKCHSLSELRVLIVELRKFAMPYFKADLCDGIVP